MNAVNNQSQNNNVVFNVVDTAFSEHAAKMGLSIEEYSDAVRAKLLSGMKNPPALTYEDLRALIFKCTKYDLEPLYDHIYTLKHGNRLTFSLTVDAWNFVMWNHPRFRACRYIYAEDMVDVPGIENFKLPSWISVELEFTDSTTFIGKRVYLLEEIHANYSNPLWNSRPSAMLANKALSQAVRFGLNIQFEDDDNQSVLVKAENTETMKISSFEEDDQVSAQDATKQLEEKARIKAALEEKKQAQIEIAQAQEAERKTQQEIARLAREKAELEAKEREDQREAQEKAELEAKEREAKDNAPVIEGEILPKEEEKCDFEAAYTQMIAELVEKHGDWVKGLDTTMRSFILSKGGDLRSMTAAKYEKNVVNNIKINVEKIIKSRNQANQANKPQGDYDFSLIPNEFKRMVMSRAEEVEEHLDLTPLTELLGKNLQDIELAYIQKNIDILKSDLGL